MSVSPPAEGSRPESREPAAARSAGTLWEVAPPPPPIADRLREIFSRAVEDQLHEQRALQALVGDVRRVMLETRKLTPDELRTVLDETAAAIAGEVRTASAAVEWRVYDVAARLDDLHAAVTSAVDAGALADLRDGLAGARTDLIQLPELVAAAITQTVTRAVSVAIGDLRLALGELADVPKELRELRAELQQLRAAVASQSDDDLVARVQAAARSAAHAAASESERRLAEHIDAAVLALAEQLARGREAR